MDVTRQLHMRGRAEQQKRPLPLGKGTGKVFARDTVMVWCITGNTQGTLEMVMRVLGNKSKKAKVSIMACVTEMK